MRVRLLAVAAALFAVLQFGPVVMGPLATFAYARTHSYLALYFMGWTLMLVLGLAAAFFISRSSGLVGPRLAVATVVGTAALVGVLAAYGALFVSVDFSRPMLIFIYSTLGSVLLNLSLVLAATVAAWLGIRAVARPARERT